MTSSGHSLPAVSPRANCPSVLGPGWEDPPILNFTVKTLVKIVSRGSGP